MTEYAKLIQAYDPEKHLLLILTPQLVEIMYTAKNGGPEYLDPLDSWVDQFLNQYVSHGNIITPKSQPRIYFPRDHGQDIG
jgi:hypothetical protein